MRTAFKIYRRKYDPICYTFLTHTNSQAHISCYKIKHVKIALKRQCVRAIHVFKTTNLSLLREIITNKSLVLCSNCKYRHQNIGEIFGFRRDVFVAFILQEFCGAQDGTW